MKTHQLLTTGIFCLGLTLSIRAAHANQQPSAPESGVQKPNILFILADDMRPDCIGALGNSYIHTPNIDRLVKQGVTFNNCYVMGSDQTAVCTPSRAMLMTGRTLFHIPMDIGSKGNNPSVQVDFQMLRASGYDTFYLGKNGRTYNPGCHAADRCEVFSETFSPKNKDICPDKAIAYLREPERTKRPFYFSFAISVPHDPLSPAPEDLALYQGQHLPPLAPNSMASHAEFAGFTLRDTDCRPYGVSTVKGGITSKSSSEQMQKALAEYYAVITGYDKQIGRILDELDRTGLTKNTLIIFASDNGLSHSDHGLIHKQSLYETDNHVPLILCGPGIPAGQKRDTFVYLSDTLPTMLDLVGVPVPTTVEAKSFAGSITDPNHVHRQHLYTAYRHEIRTFREGDYKLLLYKVCFSNARYTQLFNIKEDPFEKKDLAKDPAQAERVQRMIAEARQAGKELGEGVDKNMNYARTLKFWEYWDKRHEFGAGDVQHLPEKYQIDSDKVEWDD